MIRWVKGAKPGKASVKWKCEPEEVQERKKRYEETGRTCDFLPSWKKVGLGCCTVKRLVKIRED
jgi:hypothetical protein